MQPRIPEIGQSPLLNKRVIDKPIVDPLLTGDTHMAQPAPQPQPQQGYNPQPEQFPQQPQAQPGPNHLIGDASTDHLINPQSPVDDLNLRTMTFDDMGGGDDEQQEGGSGGEDGGGESSTVQLPKGQAKEFAEVVVTLYSTYSPVLFSKFAKINLDELEMLEAQNIIPPGATDLFRKINNNTEGSLQLTEDEQKMLAKALKAFLEWKNIEAANPGTALALTIGAILLRQGLTTVQYMGQNRKMYAEFLQEYAQKAQPSAPQTEAENKTEA